MFARPRLVLGIASIGTAAALALTGCASNSDSTGPAGGSSSDTSSSALAPTTSSSTDASLAALVPAAIKSKGSLTVGVNVPYAPNEFLQGSTVVGFDVDLMNATAAALGLKTTYRQADFDKIIPAVKAGTMDIGMSSFTDTKERESSVDFVDYFKAGVLWAAPKGKTVDPTNACGLTVSVQSDTYEQQTELPALSTACTKAGKSKITILPYASQDAATTAAILGKSDAVSADSPIISYAIKQSGGKLAQAGDLRDSAPYGWAIAKGSSLDQAMQKALQQLIDNGTYTKICEKWGVQAGAIQTAGLNGATS